MSPNIQDNLKKVKAEIQSYASISKYPKPQLLAVSKRQAIAKIEQAINSGQRDFGENQVQEALTKINFFKDSNLIWHFIGPIQSNKTKDIAENFSWVHSVDRLKIAKRLSHQRLSNLKPLNICLQVNIDNEPQKHGFKTEEILNIALKIKNLPNIRLRGLMAIPKKTDIYAEQLNSFKKLKALFDELVVQDLAIDTLSMGMSTDLKAAVIAGASWVRIGSNIFGKREE